MSNKLQELTDKLYQEGLSKGKQEGEELLAKARAEAQKTLEQAQEKAAAIIADAQREAENLKSKADADLKMASGMAITQIKHQIETAVVTKALGEPLKEAFGDKDFLKGLITTVVKAFKADSNGAAGLDVILPAAVKNELGEKFAEQLSSEMGKGIEVNFAKGISGGFKIGPKDGGFLINFTDEDFTNMFGQYLRPATRKILFGE